MKITLKKITIREVSKDYKETDNGKVVGYGGKLNI